ncbi:MAG: protein kinase, partial [Myxococcota bacterium]|nr:protein kinase [Myxococcota bacterium]
MEQEGRRYRILKILGRGGFGTVYRAEMLGSGGFSKAVALKVLNDSEDLTTEFGLRLRDEARMLGLLQHRAIVSVHGLVRLERGWAVVMEYVPGVDCSEIIKDGPMPPSAGLEIVEEVASALHAAYWLPAQDSGEALKLIHRDIKPSNIRITPSGEVKVLDFGVATADFQSREAVTQSMLFGSFTYMAPERLDGFEGPEVDMYSLGLVAARLLVGKTFKPPPKNPTRHREFIGLMATELRDALIEPRWRLDPVITARVEELVLGMLRFTAEQRHSARDVEEACRALRMEMRGGWLRQWAEENVPRLVEGVVVETQDDMTGKLFSEIQDGATTIPIVDFPIAPQSEEPLDPTSVYHRIPAAVPGTVPEPAPADNVPPETEEPAGATWLPQPEPFRVKTDGESEQPGVQAPLSEPSPGFLLEESLGVEAGSEEESSPQTIHEITYRVRRVVMEADGPVGRGRGLGPLSREAVEERISLGKLGPGDQVAMDGGPWQVLSEHPSFEVCFQRGHERFRKVRGRRRQEERKLVFARGRWLVRTVSLLVIIGAFVVLPWFARERGLFVVPESWLEQGQSWIRDMRTDSVRSSPEEPVVLADARVDPVVEALLELPEDLDAPVELWLQRGWRALGRGNSTGAMEARSAFYRALQSSPEDPEVLVGLVESLAALVEGYPELTEELLVRVEQLVEVAPGAHSTLRARASALLALGNEEMAGPLAAECLSGEEGAGDSRCSALYAEARGELAELEELVSANPGNRAFRKAQLRVAASRGDWLFVETLAKELTELDPTDPEPWALASRAAFEWGAWSRARVAATTTAELESSRLEERHRRARISLVVDGEPQSALEDLESILASPDWDHYLERELVLSDVSAAALLLLDPERGLDYAERALELRPGRPAALLHQARALHAMGRPHEATSALREVDPLELEGRDGAHYHLGASRVALAQDRLQDSLREAHAARDLAPHWADPRLAAAQVAVELGDFSGASRNILSIALIDTSFESSQSPLIEVLLPRPDWRPLLASLQDRLDEALVLEGGPATVLAIVAWQSGVEDPVKELLKALASDRSQAYAHAALAQCYLADELWAKALVHLDHAIREMPTDAVLHGMRGNALAHLGREAESDAAFSRAFQFDVPDP